MFSIMPNKQFETFILATFALVEDQFKRIQKEGKPRAVSDGSSDAMLSEIITNVISDKLTKEYGWQPEVIDGFLVPILPALVTYYKAVYQLDWIKQHVNALVEEPFNDLNRQSFSFLGQRLLSFMVEHKCPQIMVLCTELAVERTPTYSSMLELRQFIMRLIESSCNFQVLPTSTLTVRMLEEMKTDFIGFWSTQQKQILCADFATKVDDVAIEISFQWTEKLMDISIKRNNKLYQWW